MFPSLALVHKFCVSGDQFSIDLSNGISGFEQPYMYHRYEPLRRLNDGQHIAI